MTIIRQAQRLQNIDKGLVTRLAFVELRKAFDTVDDDIMLADLKGFWINCKEYNWLSSYLAGRSQPVSLDGRPSVRVR